MRDKSLLRWVVGEGNAFLNIAFKAIHTSLEEGLLVVIDFR